MAYSDFSPPRRSRRRRNIVILIVLAIIVGVLWLAVRYRTERRETMDYLEVAEEIATEHVTLSEQLGALLQGMAAEDRPAMELRLETLAADASDAVDVLDEQVVSRPVAEIAGLMSVAVESWADGLAMLKSSMLGILDAEDGDVSADEDLATAFELIRLGDRAYLEAVARVADLEPDLVPVPFPEVSYAGGPYRPLYDYGLVADRLRRYGGLAERVDVALTANTVPAPVSETTGGIWTIPSSDSLSLEVTVSNTGNVVVEQVSILVTLQKVGTAEEFPPLGQLIPGIEPGESEVRLFENLEIASGEVYSITATATVEGENNTEDNTFNLVFERNAE